jgi:hypothetical protein
MLGAAIGQPLAVTVLRSGAFVDVIATPVELPATDWFRSPHPFPIVVGSIGSRWRQWQLGAVASANGYS